MSELSHTAAMSLDAKRHHWGAKDTPGALKSII